MALEDALGWEGASEEEGIWGELLESPGGETPHLVVSGVLGCCCHLDSGACAKVGPVH